MDLWRRKQREEDLDRELRSHLELEAAEQQEAGLRRDEARYAAQRALGNATSIKEAVRDMSGWTSRERFGQDLRYAARSMRRNPAFFLSAILILALGIGVNTAVFTVVRSVVLNPLPFPDAQRLVMLWKNNRNDPGNRSGVAPADFLDFQQQVRSCAAVAAFTNTFFDVTGVEEPYRIIAARVSSNFFATLGVHPAVGRDFTQNDDQPAANRVAILSDALWQRRFSARPDVIGDDVSLNNERYTIVGVMPAGFVFPEVTGLGTVPELWTSLRFTDERTQRGSGYMRIVARLGPGASQATAQAELETLSRQFEASQPRAYGGKLLTVVPLHQEIVRGVRRLLLVLWGAVICVLLVACTNLANMLLVRATSRTRELAVRASLGASHWRLTRQLLTENVAFAVCGGAVGLALAFAAIRTLPAMGLISLPRMQEIAMDGSVLTFSLGLSVLTGVFFGVLPAWRISRVDPQRYMQEANRVTGGRGANLLRVVFGVIEVSLALLLVTGSGLLIRSFLTLQKANLGFQPENVLTFELPLPSGKYERKQAPAYYQEVAERIWRFPHVQGVGMISYLPLAGNVFGWGFLIQGRPTPTGAPMPYAEYRIVSHGLFSALRIPIKKGRGFEEQDKVDAPPVGIVNETMARRYWPNEDPIGKQFRLGGPQSMFPWVTVVGVASDVHYGGVDVPPEPTIYRPLSQAPSTALAVVVRASANPMGLAGPIRNEVRSIDRSVPLLNVREFAYFVSESFALRRFVLIVLSTFAGLALFLAAFGIYSVVAYSVTQRTQEIGLRVALGAHRGDILKLVLTQGMMVSITGIAVGLIGIFAFARVMTSLLYNVAPTDPFTIAAVCVILLAVTVTASYLPARRALRVDPMVALRYE